MVEGDTQVLDGETVVRQPIVQEKLREQTVQKPGDVYVKQDIVRPYITKQHVQVQFNEPAPVFRKNETIMRPAQEVNQEYTFQHEFGIPVEDQRLVAAPAKVAYDIPVHHYQYIPVYSQGCVPANGCVPKPTEE